MAVLRHGSDRVKTFWAYPAPTRPDLYPSVMTASAWLHAEFVPGTDVVSPDGNLLEPRQYERDDQELVRRGLSVRILDVNVRERERGVGRVMLEALEKYAREFRRLDGSGWPGATLHGLPVPDEGVRNGLKGLLRFYKKCGFAHVGDQVVKILTKEAGERA